MVETRRPSLFGDGVNAQNVLKGGVQTSKSAERLDQDHGSAVTEEQGSSWSESPGFNGIEHEKAADAAEIRLTGDLRQRHFRTDQNCTTKPNKPKTHLYKCTKINRIKTT